jgi:hypothetical protein
MEIAHNMATNHCLPLLADPEIGDLADVVDTDWFDPDADPAAWRDLGNSLRRQFVTDGVASLPGFVRPDAVRVIAEEFDRARPFVPIVSDRRSVYARDSRALGDHVALSAESDWVAGHITRDMIPAHSPAHRLYVSPRMKSLIEGCVDAEHLYEYADPLAGLIATVLPPGGCYGWHYDTSEYVVTVGIREADAGGRFEYCRNLRTPGDENLDGLAAVMSGTAADAARSVLSAPGDLQIFAGRYSLHRVTEVSGAADRITLVLAYADRPGVIGPIDRTRRVYGRVTEAHLVASAAHPGADGLIL